MADFKPDRAGHGYDMGQFLPHGPRPDMSKVRTLKASEESVPVKSLKASQPYVHKDFQETKAGKEQKPIEIFRDRHGVNHVLDGNHRAAAAVARGDSSVKARVYEQHPDDTGDAFGGEKKRSKIRWF